MRITLTSAVVMGAIVGTFLLGAALLSARQTQQEAADHIKHLSDELAQQARDLAFMQEKALTLEKHAGAAEMQRGRPASHANIHPIAAHMAKHAVVAQQHPVAQQAGELDGLVPISLDSDFKGATLCRLDFAKHAANPAQLPMFKDLVRASGCESRKNTQHVTWEQMERMAASSKQPAGFVFHESRVGSTLVADMLASDPDNMVYSESKPPPTIASHCSGCSEARQIKLLQTTILAMGNSAKHKRLFFKFQSSNTPNIQIFLKAFPNVPWIYLYRDPVEVLASQFKNLQPSASPPCSRGNGPHETQALFGSSQKVSNLKYCAGRLGMFGERALDALGIPGSHGLVVNYNRLPNFLVDAVVPKHFLYGPFLPSVRDRMLDVSSVYSKGRNAVGTEFTADSANKQEKASPEMRQLAEQYMMSSYTKLEAKSSELIAHLESVDSSMMQAAASRRDVLPADAAPAADPPFFVAAAQAAVPVGNARQQHDVGDFAGYPVDHMAVYTARKAAQVAAGLDPRWPVASAFGNSVDGGNYVPTGLEGTDVPDTEESIPTYLPFPPLQPLTELLEIWPPDDPEVPAIPGIHAGSLARFDYRDPTQRAEAKRMQEHEIPFMLTNSPEVEEVKRKWASDDYLIKQFGDRPQHMLKSDSNHFMYWSKQSARAQKEAYTPPTSPLTGSFKDFLAARDKAMVSPIESDHIYLQINSDAEHRFIPRDLQIFEARKSFWIVDPKKNRGINCRWGARGIIAETHYDGGRNFVAMLRGQKRYLLLPPSDCNNLYLYPRGHPEGRHAKADWSKLDIEKWPLMRNAKGTQVILRAGEVLYIPSYWFHYIVSLDGSIQCNTRSGSSNRGRPDIKECGFY